MTTTKPRLKLVDGKPVPATKRGLAEVKFGREFPYDNKHTNYLRNPEPVLSRWARRADYFNLSPRQSRPAWAVCHFKEQK